MLRTIGSSIARKIRETGGAILGIGGIADGEFLQRSGNDIVGASGTGGGDTLPVVDTKALVKDPDDATKLVRIDAGAVATGTTRTITMPDRDVNLGNTGVLNLDIENGTDIGEALADGDKLPLYNLSGTARVVSAVSRIWTYIQTKIAGASTKATPVDDDSLPLVDSEASNVTKRLLWSALKSRLLTEIGKDQDDMTDDSASHFPTQQSTKAYVDSKVQPVEWFYAAGGFLYPTADPAVLDVLALTNGRLAGHLFDDTTPEFIIGQSVVPTNVDTSGNLTVYVYHAAVTAAASKNTEYRLGYKALGDGEDLDATYTDSDSGDLAMSATQDYLSRHSWTISQSGFTALDLFMFRLSRIAPSANNLVGDDRVFLVGLKWARA